MKTLLFAILVILVLTSISWGEERIDLNVRYREYRIRVDLKPRILIIQNDGAILRMQYFSNDAFTPKMQFLGEEIYRNSKKVRDTFREND